VADRFYAPTASRTGVRVHLPDSEAAHLTHVLRPKAGATIQIFDGKAHEFIGAIITTDRTDAVVETLEPFDPVPQPRVTITLAPAILKRRKFDSIVRDAVMLGVSALQPLVRATLMSLRWRPG